MAWTHGSYARSRRWIQCRALREGRLFNGERLARQNYRRDSQQLGSVCNADCGCSGGTSQDPLSELRGLVRVGFYGNSCGGTRISALASQDYQLDRAKDAAWKVEQCRNQFEGSADHNSDQPKR